MEKIISNIKKELEELKDSKLIIDFILDTNERNNPKIEITLLEKEKINIELGENYCYKVLKNQKLYESFESLLNDLSPLYSTTFWSNIITGINKKKEKDNSDELDDDDNNNNNEDDL